MGAGQHSAGPGQGPGIFTEHPRHMTALLPFCERGGRSPHGGGGAHPESHGQGSVEVPAGRCLLTPNTSIWGNLEQQGDPHPWEAPASWPWETRASL